MKNVFSSRYRKAVYISVFLPLWASNTDKIRMKIPIWPSYIDIKTDFPNSGYITIIWEQIPRYNTQTSRYFSLWSQSTYIPRAVYRTFRQSYHLFFNKVHAYHVRDLWSAVERRTIRIFHQVERKCVEKRGDWNRAYPTIWHDLVGSEAKQRYGGSFPSRSLGINYKIGVPTYYIMYRWIHFLAPFVPNWHARRA